MVFEFTHRTTIRSIGQMFLLPGLEVKQMKNVIGRFVVATAAAATLLAPAVLLSGAASAGAVSARGSSWAAPAVNIAAR